MFFCPDLIRRNQNFALLWTAATQRQKLKKMRTECLNCDVIEACEEVKSQMIKGRVLFSLCLCGQLMSGVARIFNAKVTYVLSDAEKVAYSQGIARHKGGFHNVGTADVDLKRRVARHDEITNEDPIQLMNAGRIIGNMFDNSIDLTTINEIVSFDQLDSTLPHHDRNQARPEDITMAEPDQNIIADQPTMMDDFAQSDFDMRMQEVLMSGQAPDADLLNEMQALDTEHMYHPSQMADHHVFATPAPPIHVEDNEHTQQQQQEGTPSVATRATPQPQLPGSPVYLAQQQQQMEEIPAVEDDLLPLALDSLDETRRPKVRRGAKRRARLSCIVDENIMLTSAQLKAQMAESHLTCLNDDEIETTLFRGVHRLDPTPSYTPFAWTRVETNMARAFVQPCFVGGRKVTTLLRESHQYPEPVHHEFNEFIKKTVADQPEQSEDLTMNAEEFLQQQENVLMEENQEQTTIDGALLLHENVDRALTPALLNQDNDQQLADGDGTVAKGAHSKQRRESQLIDLDDTERAPKAKRAKRNKTRAADAIETDEEEKEEGRRVIGDESLENERERKSASVESSLQGKRSSLVNRRSQQQALDEQTDVIEATHLQPIDETHEPLTQSERASEPSDSQVPVFISNVQTRLVFDKLLSLGAMTEAVPFSVLCPPNNCARATAAKTFGALLVMIKAGLISVKQDQEDMEQCAEMYITVLRLNQSSNE